MESRLEKPSVGSRSGTAFVRTCTVAAPADPGEVGVWEVAPAFGIRTAWFFYMCSFSISDNVFLKILETLGVT